MMGLVAARGAMWRYCAAGLTFAVAGMLGHALLRAAPACADEPGAAPGSGIAGKVVFEGKPLSGARVRVFRDAASGFHGAGFANSAPVGTDGAFSIPLPPGSYYLIATMLPGGQADGDPQVGGYFGYFGANPIAVQEGRFTERTVQLVRRAPVTVEPGPIGDAAVIAGTVTGPQGPVAGATVYLYADAARQFRGPDLFGPQGAVPGGTGERGEFSIEAPPGTYHLVAAKRQGGALLGPLQPGDLQGYFDGNPLAVAAGTRTVVIVQVVGKQRDTAIAGERAPAGRTGIRGTVRGADGKAPAGVYAFATTDPSYMIGAMPPYRSQPIGPDGVFLIEVPAPGTYYVSARSGYGGPPLPGEWHGVHGGEKAAPVVVEPGRVTEAVDVVVRRME
jgi:hypothetical protein